tara:strand:- start:344 stop:754 length:411 start_codon:yes stop_codon:yes gene_type:complete
MSLEKEVMFKTINIVNKSRIGDTLKFKGMEYCKNLYTIMPIILKYWGFVFKDKENNLLERKDLYIKACTLRSIKLTRKALTIAIDHICNNEKFTYDKFPARRKNFPNMELVSLMAKFFKYKVTQESIRVWMYEPSK